MGEDGVGGDGTGCRLLRVSTRQVRETASVELKCFTGIVGLHSDL